MPGDADVAGPFDRSDAVGPPTRETGAEPRGLRAINA